MTKTAAEATELFEVAAVSGKLLHPIVPAVDHVQLVGRVERESRRSVQLSVAGAGLTPTAQEFTVAVIDGNAVEPFVGNINIAVAIHCHRRRPDKLAFSFAAAAELAEIIPAQGAFRHAQAIGAVFK